MNFDFSTIIPRKGTGCIKFDRRPELTPYWVADMDFVSPPCILNALHERVNHGVFGYAQAHAGLVDAILNYLQSRRNATVTPDQIVHLGGLVPALSLAGRAFCQPGDEIMTATPVYPPFLGVHKDSHAKLLTCDHILVDGQWTFDWETMERLVTPKTKVFLLCNPQNPLGQVFTQAEIIRLAEFCERHQLILVSDEIHCDLILDEAKTPHFSALNLPDTFANRTITLLSPSKTWNIAGLGYAYAVIPNPSVRQAFQAAFGHTLTEINALSYYAAEAAYRDGEPWRLALIEQLRTNQNSLVEFIRTRCPSLSIHPGQATYLAWIDASAMKVPNPAQHFEKNAGLFLSDGAAFHWPNHIRFNFACPHEWMMQGLEKMAAVLP